MRLTCVSPACNLTGNLSMFRALVKPSPSQKVVFLPSKPHSKSEFHETVHCKEGQVRGRPRSKKGFIHQVGHDFDSERELW